jgi:ABC-type transporter Mla subunit MlaD
MRKLGIIAASAIVVASIAALGWHFLPWNHRLRLTAYFQGVEGLRAGAPVELAGVAIGSVESVRVLPAKKEAPAEVAMVISTPYELKIPNDSVVSIAQGGILGDKYVEIKSNHAVGPPATSGAVLKSAPPEPDETKLLLKRLVETAEAKAKQPQLEPNGTPDAKGAARPPQ